MSSTDSHVVYKAKNKRKINLDLSKDALLTEHSNITLKGGGYQREDEPSPQYSFARACCAFSDDSEHAQRLYNYASSLWFGFATPVLVNGGTDLGLPISCFLNHIQDSRFGLAENYVENIWLSTMGGGIGTYWGNIRSIGTKTSTGTETTGLMPFLKTIDSQMLAYKQGSTRRGSNAAYVDISHPEIIEFINFRNPNIAGDPNRKCMNLNNAINIPDTFMQAVTANADWDLIDPHTKVVTETVKARELWKHILKTRIETGEPYLHFIDTTNRALPETQKALGLRVSHSNLCSEITLPTSDERTAVCCLSSVNIERFDEWKDHPLFVEDLIRMLDNVLQFFIDNAPNTMWRAINSAERERSLGLGQMGVHSWLLKKGIPFESPMAIGQTRMISKQIHEQAIAASIKLATERGEPADMKGTGRRNAHLLAIAPTASNSLIADCSPGIEPWAGNAFKQKTSFGTFYMQNKYLKVTLAEKYNKDTQKVWNDIFDADGSVQHLEWMDQQDKDLYKTFIEMDQMWVVEHAAVRQEFICQAQSTNLSFYSNVHAATLNKVHGAAWKKGLKTLYYCRSQSPARNEVIRGVEETNKLNNDIPNTDENECLSCQ